MSPSLDRIGSWSRNVLAVVGVAALLYQAGMWLYRQLTLSDMAGAARPICELHPFDPVGNLVPDGSEPLRLVGVEIYAINQLSDVSIKMTGLKSVSRWAVESDGMSESDRGDFLTFLSTGPVYGTIITQQIPRIAAGSKTTVLALAHVGGSFDCRSNDWLTVLTGSQKIYHTDLTFARFREGPTIALWGTQLLIPPVIIALAIMVYAFVKKRHQVAGLWSRLVSKA